MFLLDTNVISQRVKPRPNVAVTAWLQGIATEQTFLSAISIQEICYGAEKKKPGFERSRIEAWIRNDLMISLASRILPVDAAVAETCGRLAAHLQSSKRYTPSPSDALIAATAITHGLAVATLNRKHFEPLGVKLVSF